MNADATTLPPPPPTAVAASCCDDDEPLNERDFEEACTIAAGESLMLPELRHLVALVKAYDEALDLAVGCHTYVDRRVRASANRGGFAS